MPILPQLLMGGSPVTGAIPTSTSIAESVDFDGTNDYLSRSSDFVGNVDSKTFTFSCWVYYTGKATALYDCNATGGIFFETNSAGNNFKIQAFNSADSRIFVIDQCPIKNPIYTWSHILISVDLGNVSNRHVYIDDAMAAVRWDTYTDDSIDFTQPNHNIGSMLNGYNKVEGRLANLFLSYDYIDLSVESNRRLFITEDGKPAEGLAALNPIMYLPMTDHTTCHTNEGTGGDFVQNGVIGQSERGPNQWNCVASEFDGVDDYLSSTDIGASDSKLFTFSCTIMKLSSPMYVFNANLNNSGSSIIIFFHYNSFRVTIRSADTNNVLYATFKTNIITTITTGILFHFSCSFDLSNTSKRHAFINGIEVVGSYDQYVDAPYFIGDCNVFRIGGDYDATGLPYGSLGELYLSTNYIDLATDNPFWDSDANLPNPVRQVIEETGVTPLIAMPISADDPGKNYGTGGDFTLNGGGLTGARGASEFIARSAKFSSGNYLLNPSISGVSDAKTGSFVVAFKSFDILSGSVLTLRNPYDTINDQLLKVLRDSNAVQIYIYHKTVGKIARMYKATIFTQGEWTNIFCSYDLSDTGKRNCYIGGVDVGDAAWVTYTDQIIEYSGMTRAGVNWVHSTSTEVGEDDIASMYFTTDYIDFSDEAERLKFVDGLGFPVDIQPAIDSGDIPKPLFYLPFDDPDNLGKDMSGNDNHFTVNGTVTPGSDFTL